MASKRSAMKAFSPEPLLKRRAVGSEVSWQRSPAASLAQTGPVILSSASAAGLLQHQLQKDPVACCRATLTPCTWSHTPRPGCPQFCQDCTLSASHAGDWILLVSKSAADCSSAGAPDFLGKGIPCPWSHATQRQHVHGRPQLALLHAHPGACLSNPSARNCADAAVLIGQAGVPHPASILERLARHDS